MILVFYLDAEERSPKWLQALPLIKKGTEQRICLLLEQLFPMATPGTGKALHMEPYEA